MKFNVAARLVTGETVKLVVKAENLEEALTKAKADYNAEEVWEWEDFTHIRNDKDDRYWIRKHSFMTKTDRKGRSIKIFG